MLFSPTPHRQRLQLRISERRLLLMTGDAMAVVVSIFFSLYLWSQVADEPFNTEFILPQLYWFPVLLGLWLLLASANDFYELAVAANRATSLQRLGLITLQLLVVYLLVFFFSPRDALPRLFILYYGVSSFVLIALWRLLNPALVGWASEPRRVLIVGTGWGVESIMDAIRQHGQRAYDVRGIIGGIDDVGRLICDIPVIGTGSDLMNFVLRDRITEIIFMSVPDMTNDIFKGLMQAYERGVVLTPMPLLYERLTGRVPVEHVNTNWALVLPIDGNTLFNLYPVLDWILNKGIAIVGMVVFVLLLPLLALVIKLDSPGSVFYRQKRLGINGREFDIIKFRTMVQNAEAQTGAVFSKSGDPRVTRIGRFMRKTRLDELPQVINILRGEMSIVGPRPERPEHVARLTEKIPFYRTRLVVRPGLTGWAQVRYSYGSTDEDALVKLEYDLYYIRHQSLLLDLNIMIRTVGKVLRMSGV
ncbi:MAG: sugar transferase [bacterium]|nr:sugar transferase [bacterium]